MGFSTQARVQGDFAALLVESLTYGLHRQARALFVSDVQHDPAIGAVPRGMRRADTVAVDLAAGVGRLLRQDLQVLAAGAGRAATVAGAAGPDARAGSAGHAAAGDPATTYQERESGCADKARLPHCPSSLAP